MKNQKIFLLIFYIIFFSIWGRVDITRNIYTPGDASGSWKDWTECIDNTYVYGFALKQECDYLGTLCTKLFCRALDGSSDSSIVSYEDTDGGISYSGSRTCSSGDFANSYKMVYNGWGYLTNEISFNDLSLKCVISNTFLVSGYGCGSGDTSPVKSCEPSELLCAFRIRWEPNTAVDDNRQSDIEFKCCKICKSLNGFFLQTSTSPPSCATCSRYCKTCSGEIDNQCLSCFSGDTSNGNSCDRSSNFYEILNEFSSTNIVSTTGFTSNKGTTVGSCGSWGLVGGNGVFGSGDWIQKDFSNQPPFYKIRVKCRLMKIDDWTSHSFKVEVDGHSFSIPEAQNIDSNSGALYFGNICGNSLPEDIIDLDSILSYYQATFSVKFSTDLDGGTKYWGIRDLIIGVYKCHDTCMTCTESTDLDCVNCYPHASKVSGKCTCDDTYFKVTPNNPCTSYPCIICTSCFTGCKQCASASQTDCSSCCVTDCPSTPVSWGDSATRTCVPTCPQVTSINQFGDVSDHRICKPCNSNCYTCSGTATHCLSCTGSSYLLSNQCYSTCPTIYYGVPATNICQDPCPDSEFKHDVDKICYATCPASYFGNPISGKCENPCPSDMYGDSSTHRCEFCDFNCLTCSGSPTHCTGCKYGWTLSSNVCQIPQNIYVHDSKFVIGFNEADVSSSGFSIISSNLGTHANACGSYNILGGSSDFGQNTRLTKSYTNLVPHYKARITFYFLKIDDWSNNKISVLIDNTEVDSKTFVSGIDSVTTKFCGDSSKYESLRQFDIYKNHVSNQLDIEIKTDLAVSSSIASWGIYGFTLYLDRCHETCKTCTGSLISNCDSCYDDATLTSNTCLCNSHFYPVSVTAYTCNIPICTVCTTCNSECKNCDGGTNSDCLDCALPRFFSSRQCYLICPDPFVGITDTILCETSCHNTNEYIDLTDRVCKTCHPDCPTCTGPLSSQCKSCFTGKFLLMRDETTFDCVEDCGAGYWGNVDNAACVKCNEKCKTCLLGTENDCLSCENSKYLYQGTCFVVCPKDSNNIQLFGNNITHTCENSCPSKTYGDLGAKVCFPCSYECKKCNGLSNTQCSECESGFYLEDKTNCLFPCSNGYFLNSEKNTCDVCVTNCLKCLNINTCTECKDPFFLMQPSNQSCNDCTANNNFKEMKLCYICDIHCKKCKNKNQCEICETGYYNYNGNCKIQTNLKAVLENDGIIPSVVHLKFDNYWETGFKDLKNIITISISGLQAGDFTFDFTKNSTLNTDFILSFTFKKSISDGSILKLKIDFSDIENPEYNLLTKELTLSLKKHNFCKENMVYDSKTSQCVNLVLITPILSYGDTSDIYLITFDINFPAFFAVLPNNANITIEGISPTFYTYTFSLEKLIFTLQFNFNKSLTSKPLLKIFLIVPLEVKYSESNVYALKYDLLSISMKDIYLLSLETKEVIEATKETTKQISSIAEKATVANNLLSAGTSFAFRSVMSMDSIRFLKFLDVNFPPNVLEMFKSALPTPGIVPNVNIPEDPNEIVTLPAIFDFQEVSIYLFNNNGNTIIENLTYLFVSIIIYGINYLILKTNYKYVKFVSSFITVIFVWNLPLTYFFSCFMNYIFYNLLFFRYPTIGTKMGYFNLALAFSETFVIIFILYMTFRKINFFHEVYKIENFQMKRKLSSNNAISPIIDEPPTEVMTATTAQFKKKNITTKEDISSLKELDTNNETRKLSGSGMTNGKELEKQDEKISPTSEIGDINNKYHFTPNHWDQMSSLTKASKFGRKSLGKINPFDEDSDSPIPTMKKVSIFFSKIAGINYGYNSPEKEAFRFKKNREPPSPLRNAMRASIKIAGMQKLGSRINDDIYLEKLKNKYGCLHQDFKHSNKFQSYYILFDLFRQTFLAAFVIFLFNYAIIALLLINVVNIIFIIFLIVANPFREKIDIIQTILNEICLNSACVATLVISVWDKMNYNDIENRMLLGWIIVGANTGLILIFILRFSLIAIYFSLYYTYKLFKFIRSKINKNKITPITSFEQENKVDKKKGNAFIM